MSLSYLWNLVFHLLGFKLPAAKRRYQLLARQSLGRSGSKLDGIQVLLKINYELLSFKTIFRDNKTVGRELTVLKEPSPGVRPLSYSDPRAHIVQEDPSTQFITISSSESLTYHIIQELCLTNEFGTLRPRKCDNKFCAFCKKSTKKFVKEERWKHEAFQVFMISYPGPIQSLYCWKDFVKLRRKKILFLTPNSIQVGGKMAGSISGSSRFIWQILAPAIYPIYCMHSMWKIYCLMSMF